MLSCLYDSMFLTFVRCLKFGLDITDALYLEALYQTISKGKYARQLALEFK